VIFVTDVILPVLNEREALPWVLGRMPAGYRAIVVDNGSEDGSAEVAIALGALVVSEPRRGFGSACAAGLNAATSDVVCFMDADCSLDPQELPQVSGAVERGEADLVLGRRVAEPGAWPRHAILANRVLMSRVRRATTLTLRDLGPMRAARRLDLVELGIEDRRSGWPLEMVLRAYRAGWGVNEVPVAYRPRVGRSKVTGTVRGTMQAIGDMAALLR
jgi:glycosyltransferase involved in cell wall biosynthesis